jgi:hypothetical protein
MIEFIVLWILAGSLSFNLAALLRFREEGKSGGMSTFLIVIAGGFLSVLAMLKFLAEYLGRSSR